MSILTHVLLGIAYLGVCIISFVGAALPPTNHGWQPHAYGTTVLLALLALILNGFAKYEFDGRQFFAIASSLVFVFCGVIALASFKKAKDMDAFGSVDPDSVTYALLTQGYQTLPQYAMIVIGVTSTIMGLLHVGAVTLFPRRA